ncbi:MAG: hypothetical protein WBD07_04330 [Vicinamibacterales bacterium]
MMRQRDDSAAIVELVRPAAVPAPTEQLAGPDDERFDGSAFEARFQSLLESFDDLPETSVPEAPPLVPAPDPPSIQLIQTEEVQVEDVVKGGAFSTGLDALLDGLDGLAEKHAPEARPVVPAPEPPSLQTEDVLEQSGVHLADERPSRSLGESLHARSHAPVVSLRADLGAPEIGAMVAVALITTGLWPLLHQAALVVPGGVLLWFTLPARAPFFRRASSNQSPR